MPFNGSGVFSILNQFVPNTTILSSAVNANFSDIATGLSDCLTRDGQAGMTAALKAISGTLGAPGITFNNDASSGLYLSGTGVFGVVAKSLGLMVNSSIYQATSATVQAGGSGYAVGDTITETGGTAINQAVFTVATVSGTAVATVTVAYPGNYSVVPSNPVSQGSTSGSGTGCTLNITFAAQYASSIVTNEAGALPWQRLGSSSYMSGLMASPNGLALATGIGSTALATVVGNSFIIPPGGVLSPISSTTSPVPTTDTTGNTIWWTPTGLGNNIPILVGGNMVQYTTGQLTCTLTAGAQVTGGIYDIYAFLNAGIPILGFSPSWSAGTGGSVTAGSCARGTGAGGTAFNVVQGIRTNGAAMTLNNNASTFNIGINQGTMLGSVYVNSAGSFTCHRSYGQSRLWGLFNVYNRENVYLKCGDNTATWTYSTGGFRLANNSSANTLTVFSGLAEEVYRLDYMNTSNATINSTIQFNPSIAVGVNGSTLGKYGTYTLTNQNTSALASAITLHASYRMPPSLGINTIGAYESNGGSVVNTYAGTEQFMLLTADWRA